jgi:hypothetical protein
VNNIGDESTRNENQTTSAIEAHGNCCCCTVSNSSLFPCDSVATILCAS